MSSTKTPNAGNKHARKAACRQCLQKSEIEEMVRCEDCLFWWHPTCANTLPDGDFRCTTCYEKHLASAQTSTEIPETGATRKTTSATVGNETFSHNASASNSSPVTCAISTAVTTVSSTPVANSNPTPEYYLQALELMKRLEKMEAQLVEQNKFVENQARENDQLAKELRATQLENQKLREQRNPSSNTTQLPTALTQSFTTITPPSQTTTTGAGTQANVNLNASAYGHYGNQLALPGLTFSTTFTSAPQMSSRIIPGTDGSVTENATPQIPELTRQQIAIRKTMDTRLPKFDGSAQQWPSFISFYTHTTTACGLSNQENLIRLMSSLEGAARAHIAPLLTVPENVQHIMNRLSLRFGKPETIIDHQIAEVRRLPPVTLEEPNSLIKFGDAVHNLVATMSASQLQGYLINPTLLNDLSSRLPATLRIQWGAYSRLFPQKDLTIFDAWLDALVTDLSSVTTIPTRSETRPRRVNVTQEPQEKQKGCLVCSRNCPSVAECYQFKTANRNQRWEYVKNLNLCRTCLKSHKWECKSDKRCEKDGCTRRHHPLLHNDQLNDARNYTNGTPSNYNGTKEKPHLSHKSNSDQSLFRILPIKLSNGDKEVHTYAFIDDGSSITLLEQEIADKLGLDGPAEELCLQWTSDQRRVERQSKRVTVTASPSHNDRHYKLHQVRTVTNLSLPTQTLNADELASRYPHLKGIPVESYQDAKPTILIGIDNTYIGTAQRTREGTPGDPVAVKTRLGWSVFGSTSPDEDSAATVGIHSCACQHLDNIGITKNPTALLSNDDIRAQYLLETGVKRVGKRFEAPLLWVNDDVTLPNNEILATRRTKCLQKRFADNPALEKRLNEQLDQMTADGYIRELSPHEKTKTNCRTWYLPIFPVVNPQKPDKIRLVWDARAEYKGTSLNKVLLKGQDLLPPIVQPLNRSRERKVAMSGDIRQMFHQIGMRKEDRSAQRFLWPGKNGETRCFEMNVMTFGAACSPATAQFVKNKNATEHEKDFPLAAKCIRENHYVDDWLESCDTAQEAIAFAKEVREVHANGGFHIRSWKSNEKSVVKALEGEENSVNLNFEGGCEKILGIAWQPSGDYLWYPLQRAKIDKKLLEGERKPTKREVLSILMSVYDPNGHIGHFLVQLKIILQESWRDGKDWNETINDQQDKKWKDWLNQLTELESIRIPRCYLRLVDNYNDALVQLHIFVDAGREAYAAVAYLRIEKMSNIDVAQVGTKTKVAPLEPNTIPRLELQAALIGARYAKFIHEILSIKIHQTIFWSDSMTVLGWLRSSRRYKPFVAFRIAEIREISDVTSWHYIPTDLNVADEATKSRRKVDLSNDSRWLKGPSFLQEDTQFWPNSHTELPSPEEDEIKTVTLHIRQPSIDVTRFSNWNRLLRTQAYINRFINRASKRPNPGACLTATELRDAEFALFRLAQQQAFPNEVRKLKENQLIEKSSSIFTLSPYLDVNGVMRMDSRSNKIAPDPVILPRKHYITRLIVINRHQKFLHQHNEAVVNSLRADLYISKIRKLVKAVSSSCQWCRVYASKPIIPRMAPLPLARLAINTPPFTHTGVDFFGPLVVAIGRRQEKRWGCLFTCMTTRAIYVEIAHRLTTDSFLMCLKRFLNRRGNVQHMYSDQGTNFIGAEKLLRDSLKVIDRNKFAESMAVQGVEWHFNPPHAPNMGGAWESLVKSVKRALYGAMPSRTITDEVLKSALAEVEFTINERPLTYIPIESPSLPVITPNDLLGLKKSHEMNLVPDDSPETVINTIKTSEVMANKFWHRWVAEYLPTLTRRNKWHQKTPNLKKGDVVVIVDPLSKRNEWKRGIVEDINESEDGVVRSAKVSTCTGSIVRPVSKLALIASISSWHCRGTTSGE